MEGRVSKCELNATTTTGDYDYDHYYMKPPLVLLALLAYADHDTTKISVTIGYVMIATVCIITRTKWKALMLYVQQN